MLLVAVFFSYIAESIEQSAFQFLGNTLVCVCVCLIHLKPKEKRYLKAKEKKVDRDLEVQYNVHNNR